MTPKLTIVSPVYRTGNILPEFTRRVVEALNPIAENFEIILVDDGCPENSWPVIEYLAEKDTRIKGILLSRNFGQHQAVTAGLKASSGEYTVILDSDLQDDPGLLPTLLAEIQKGYDIVYTIRKRRKQAFLRNLISRFYNFIFKFLSDKNLDINTGSLVIFNSLVKENFLKFKDKERLYIQLLKWLGFRSSYVTVDHLERYEGESSYSYAKLLNIAIQGLTTHSNKLLRLSIFSGFVLSFLSFIGIVTLVIMYFIVDFQAGWPSVVVLILFSTGLLQTSIGIAGIYIGKTFDQVKDRPLFVIHKSLNLNSDEDK